MNTSAVQYSAEPSWSRRGSIESILSIQGKETDFARDSSDTEAFEDEFEPCSASEDEAPMVGNSSGESDNEIIATKVIEVVVGDDGDLEFADSEQTATDGSDSELDLCDFWRCAQCGGRNENPLYRYCQGCFKVRKNFFPPRPKRKHKRKNREESHPLSQDSGVYSQEVQDPNLAGPNTNESDNNVLISQNTDHVTERPPISPDSGLCEDRLHVNNKLTESVSVSSVKSEVRLEMARKRRAESAERAGKRTRFESGTDSDCEGNGDKVSPIQKTVSDSITEVSSNGILLEFDKVNNMYGVKSDEVSPLKKTISDPALTVEVVEGTKEVVSETLKEIDKDNMCIMCLSEPKSGVFVHGRIAHICCCYKCALRVWAKAKRCPVCNCKVSNVLKAVVM